MNDPGINLTARTGSPVEAAYRPMRSPRGAVLSCKGWPQEAALRMLMNSLDSEVAETPEKLVVYGGNRKAARNWDCFHAIAASLRELSQDETLLVQDGNPVGIFRTNRQSPRVVVSSIDRQPGSRSDLASALGSASWLFVGTQTALPASVELFAAAARQHFDGTLAGRLVVAAGLGARGGAQPLAATLNGAAFLGVDVDPEAIKRCVKRGYCDVMVNDLDEALRILKNAVRRREAVSVGLIGNCADVVPELAQRGVLPDVLAAILPPTLPATLPDDPIRFLPQGLTVEQAAGLRLRDPDAYRVKALDSMAAYTRGIQALQQLGTVVVAASERALRWHANQQRISGPASPQTTMSFIALSGEPADIALLDRLLLGALPADDSRRPWMEAARKRIRFQGLPARVFRSDKAERGTLCRAINDLVARGELAGPIVIATENSGFAAASEGEAPECRATGMPESSVTSVGEPIPIALLRNTNGAAWVSLEQTQIAGGSYAWQVARVLVADGTPNAEERMTSVLTEALANDTGDGNSAAGEGNLVATMFTRDNLVSVPMP